MGHYPEMLLEHYAKKSICNFCSFCTCKFTSVNHFVTSQMKFLLFSFVFLRKTKTTTKKCQSTNNDKKKKKMLLNTTIFCREKQLKKQKQNYYSQDTKKKNKIFIQARL